MFSGFSQDLVTDRPDFTESATAVPKGSWQFEFGYTFEKDKNANLTTHTLGELLVRFSLVEKLEFRIGINSYTIIKTNEPVNRTSKGLEDLELGIKWALIQDNVALLVSTTVPTGADAFRSSKLQPGLSLALAKDINKTLSIGVNLGAARLYDGESRITEFSASTALGISLTDKLGMYVEYFGLYYNEDEGENAHYLDAGFTYLVNPTFQLDIRAGKKLNKGDSTYFIGVGAVIRI
jgi:hypothetical protein